MFCVAVFHLPVNGLLRVYIIYLTSIVTLLLASGLGFNIRGGSDANYLRGHPGIFVTSIKPGGSADRDSRLKIGDRLLEVK